MRQLFLWFGCIAVLVGCSQGPAVDAIWSKTRLMTIPAGEQDAFLSDRASGLQTEGKFLPPDQQGEEFYVKWHGDKIDRVKFEYRQVKAPDKFFTQEYRPQSQRSHVFTVTGDTYRNGGSVSGWRASLWHGEQLVAEMKSSLW